MMEDQAKWDHQAYKEHLVCQDHPEMEENGVPLGVMELQDLKDNQDPQVTVEHQDLKVYKGLQGLRVNKENEDRKAMLDRQDSRDYPACKDHQGSLVSQENPDVQVSQVALAEMEYRVREVTQEHKAHLVQWESRARLDLLDRLAAMATEARQDLLVPKETLVLQEILAALDNVVLLDQWEEKESLEIPERLAKTVKLVVLGPLVVLDSLVHPV